MRDFPLSHPVPQCEEFRLRMLDYVRNWRRKQNRGRRLVGTGAQQHQIVNNVSKK